MFLLCRKTFHIIILSLPHFTNTLQHTTVSNNKELQKPGELLLKSTLKPPWKQNTKKRVAQDFCTHTHHIITNRCSPLFPTAAFCAHDTHLSFFLFNLTHRSLESFPTKHLLHSYFERVLLLLTSGPHTSCIMFLVSLISCSSFSSEVDGSPSRTRTSCTTTWRRCFTAG